MAPRVNNKKVKGNDKDSKKTEKNEKTTVENLDDTSNSGFGGYLRSEQGNSRARYGCQSKKNVIAIFTMQEFSFYSTGMGYMKIFVMMNSLVMLLSMGVPAMKQAYEIVYSWLEEWELF